MSDGLQGGLSGLLEGENRDPSNQLKLPCPTVILVDGQ